jgi:hypothetical protein
MNIDVSLNQLQIDLIIYSLNTQYDTFNEKEKDVYESILESLIKNE